MTVTSAADLAAGFKLELDGTALDPSVPLLEVRVENTLGLPDLCVARIAESAFAGLGQFDVLDDARFKLGAALKVALAPSIGGSLANVFDGEVTGIEVEIVSDSQGDRGGTREELVLTAHDKSHKLHRTYATRTLQQVTVADVVKKLAGEAGLQAGTLAPAASSGVLETVTQVDESDWTFLSRLARSVGTELDVVAGKLTLLDPTDTPAPVATITHGEDVLSFRGRTSSLAQVEEVTVRGWDPKGKKVLTGSGKPKASTSLGEAELKKQVVGSKALVSTGDVTSATDAKATAEAIAARVGHERVQGEVVALGDPRLLAGQRVTIKGVGQRFSGDHRIVAAVHRLEAGSYTSALTLGAGRSLSEDVATPGRGRGFTSGLVVGLVTNTQDPDGQGRVKVKFPTLDDSLESGWARVARESAGKDRGLISILEVDDEVVVGFEHGSVQRPVVLGAMFNGKDTPGAVLPPKPGSVSARFPRDIDMLTKGKALLEFEKGLTVGAKTEAIAMTAGKDMTLKASGGGAPSALSVETTGQLKLKGDQGAEVTTTGPLKLKATGPVTLESNAAVQIKGSIIEVNASGIVKVSGATVMLG